MSEKFGFHLVIHNKDAKGKAVALYTSAPSTALALAEIELLKNRVIKKNPKKRIEAFVDIDTTIDEDEWMASYTSAADRAELMKNVERLRKELEG